MKEILLTSSALILAVIVLRLLFRSKVSRKLIYGAWLLVALRLLIPIQFGQLDFSILTQAEPVTEAITDMAQKPVSGPSREEVYTDTLHDYINQGQSVFIPEVQEQVESEIQHSGRPAVDVYDEILESAKPESVILPEVNQQIEIVVEETVRPTLGQIALGIWITGMVAMAAWFLGVNLAFRRNLRNAAPSPEPGCKTPVKISAAIASPCVFGLLRPVIYLTPNCAENERIRRHVLTHEQTHLRHGDHIWAWVRCLCLCVYWFNPLVWVAASLSKRDCELACDEDALKTLGEGERLAYGKTLVDMVSSVPAPGQLLETATAMHETKKQLKERVKCIVKQPKVFLTAAIALLLVLTIVTGCAFTGAVTDPDKTTPDSTTAATTQPVTGGSASSLPVNVGQIPLVNEPVMLKLLVLCSDTTVNPAETWQLRFLEEIVGIDIDLTYTYPGTKDAALSKLMADGDLPDLIIGMGFTPAQLTQFGAEEGLLLDIAPYLTEENAPNILAVAQEDPNWLRALTNADGQVLSLAGWTQPDPNNNVSVFRTFYNYDVLAAAGVTECPETLDEFLAMLRAIKRTFPEMYPFGGNYERYNPTYLIQNALGFNYSMGSEVANQRSHETDLGLHNGAVTLFSYDRALLPAYLKFMRTLYAEGLMDPDFYSVDKNTVKDHLKAGKYAVFSEVPGLYGGAEFGAQWWGGMPLTSSLNNAPFWPSGENYTTGGYCISAKTEYPELCVALADLFFCNNDIGRILNTTPSVNDTQYLFGQFRGWYYDAEKGEKISEDYYDPSFSRLPFHIYRLWPYSSFCVSFLDYQVDENGNSIRASLDMGLLDVNDSAAARRGLPGFGENSSVQFAYALHNTFGKYETDEQTPAYCYFDAATEAQLAAQKNALDAYATQAIADFITGKTELNEANLEAYFSQMQQLGADSYVKAYADYWAAVNS